MLVVATSASGGDRPPAEKDHLGSLDPKVSAVAGGGYWEVGAKRGRYRIVVVSYGDEHVYTRTYAQWLKLDANGELAEWITKDIPQLSDEPLGIVRSVAIEEPKEANRAVFDAIIAQRYDNEKHSVAIRLGKPGEVTVEGLEASGDGK